MMEAQFLIEKECPAVTEEWSEEEKASLPVYVWVTFPSERSNLCGGKAYMVIGHRGAKSLNGESWDLVGGIGGQPSVCEHMGHLIE